MDLLTLADAAPGYYLVASASPTVYVLDLRDAERPVVARVRGGAPDESQDFTGDNRWWPLEGLLSGPPETAKGDEPDLEDVVKGVVRVGRRHKWEWWQDGRGFDSLQWRKQRTAAAIHGPLTAEGLLALLPEDRPRKLLLVPFAGLEDGQGRFVTVEDLEDEFHDLFEHEGWASVDVLDGLLLDVRGAIVERSGSSSGQYTVAPVRWSRVRSAARLQDEQLVREAEDGEEEAVSEVQGLRAVVERVTRHLTAGPSSDHPGGALSRLK
jgi:hypothetical protein